MSSIAQRKYKSVGTPALPHYVSEDGRVNIRRQGSLPSRRWFVAVDSEQSPHSFRRLRDCKIWAEARIKVLEAKEA